MDLAFLPCCKHKLLNTTVINTSVYYSFYLLCISDKICDFSLKLVPHMVAGVWPAHFNSNKTSFFTLPCLISLLFAKNFHMETKASFCAMHDDHWGSFLSIIVFAQDFQSGLFPKILTKAIIPDFPLFTFKCISVSKNYFFLNCPPAETSSITSSLFNQGFSLFLRNPV